MTLYQTPTRLPLFSGLNNEPYPIIGNVVFSRIKFYCIKNIICIDYEIVIFHTIT